MTIAKQSVRLSHAGKSRLAPARSGVCARSSNGRRASRNCSEGVARDSSLQVQVSRSQCAASRGPGLAELKHFVGLRYLLTGSMSIFSSSDSHYSAPRHRLPRLAKQSKGRKWYDVMRVRDLGGGMKSPCKSTMSATKASRLFRI